MTRLAAVAAVAVALLVAPGAVAKTLHVRWVEQKQIAGGGSFVFKVTRIDAAPTRWSAVVAIENRSAAAYDVQPGCNGFAPQFAAPGLGIVYYAGGLGWTFGTWVRGASTFAPTLPRTFRPAARWAGTMRGRGPLPKKTDLHLSFGFFTPRGDDVAACRKPLAERSSIAGEWYWVTDHVFRL
jgi:hypothetical protein